MENETELNEYDQQKFLSNGYEKSLNDLKKTVMMLTEASELLNTIGFNKPMMDILIFAKDLANIHEDIVANFNSNFEKDQLPEIEEDKYNAILNEIKLINLEDDDE